MQRIPWGPRCWESGELCCHWRVRPSPPGVPAEAAVSLPGDLVEPGIQDWRAGLRPGSSASGLGHLLGGWLLPRWQPLPYS